MPAITRMDPTTKTVIDTLKEPFHIKKVLRSSTGERLELVIIFDPGDETELAVERRMLAALAPLLARKKASELSIVPLPRSNPAASDLAHYFPSHEVVFTQGQ